jgi:DNA polymerase-3 subunit gamma/tau
MGKALYRKYRSKNLDEIVGQPHITQTLKNALEQQTFSHAYLFTGPKGIGKTSIARILAYEVNKLPYDEEATHLDIIEIDAASNRRIDEIRELRDKVHIAPTSARFKVYIIDEVHMLTKEAFNALLKTLEEPPEHVIFILATTEAHKLPETIVSRTQRFTFKPVSMAVAIAHLRSIADQEGVQIEDDALELIAQHGGGSFRDSISLLDQVRGQTGIITLSDVQAMLGIAPKEAIEAIIAVLQDGSPSEVIDQLQSARVNGYQPAQLAKQLSESLRQSIITGSTPIDSSEITATLRALTAVPAAYDPQAALEIALLEVVLQQHPTTKIHSETDDTKPVSAPPKAAAKTTTVRPDPTPEPVVESPEEPHLLAQATIDNSTDLDEATWKAILESIKKTHNTLYSVARMAEPKISDDEIVLQFKFAFHQKRLNETKNKQIIADLASQAVGKPITITCIIGGVSQPAPQKATPAVTKNPNQDTISTISNIFGGAEVIE